MELQRRRGRPRSFDPQAALAPITEVFWRRGFEAASVDELAAAAGLNKPNLYGAFGDKRAMYKAALDGFRETLTEALEATLTGKRPLVDELDQFFDDAISVYTAGETSLGCLIMCTASVAGVEDPELRAFVSDVTAQLDAAFAARLERTVLNPLEIGPLLTALLQSLALRARSDFPTDGLRRFAKSSVRVLAT